MNKIIFCSCQHPDHSVVFRYEAEDKTLYLYTQLNPDISLFSRIKAAIRLIFKLENPYGHWEETVLQFEEINELHSYLHSLFKVKTND